MYLESFPLLGSADDAVRKGFCDLIFNGPAALRIRDTGNDSSNYKIQRKKLSILQELIFCPKMSNYQKESGRV